MIVLQSESPRILAEQSSTDDPNHEEIRYLEQFNKFTDNLKHVELLDDKMFPKRV